MRSEMTTFLHSVMARLNSIPAPDVNIFVRMWIGHVFYTSGRTKVSDSYLSVSDSTKMLFEHEYSVPLLDPVFAAHMALYVETFIPLLLFIGLASRFGAFILLGMTLVIQIFVYPGSWPDHMLWSVALIFIILRGAGKISVDHLIASKYGEQK